LQPEHGEFSKPGDLSSFPAITFNPHCYLRKMNSILTYLQHLIRSFHLHRNVSFWHEKWTIRCNVK
jgi:hypothetical protein